MNPILDYSIVQESNKKEKHHCFSLTAGDRDRTFLRFANTDRKEAGGLTLFSEPTFEPSFYHT